MADKRYQVFVSSTYEDLQEERRQVLQALLNADYIPAGMELFPAADEDQFSYIARVIDNCDYYVLIPGGRYGSSRVGGISLTEKEFDYACDKGMKVIALVHNNPSALSSEKKENSLEGKLLFDKFRDKVCTGRIVKMWERLEEIQGAVLAGLKYATEQFPAIGWVRGNMISSVEILEENRNLARENIIYKNEIEKLKKQLIPQNTNLLELSDDINIQFRLTNGAYDSTSICLSVIFCRIALNLKNKRMQHVVLRDIEKTISDIIKSKNRFYLEPTDISIFETILIQF